MKADSTVLNSETIIPRFIFYSLQPKWNNEPIIKYIKSYVGAR